MNGKNKEKGMHGTRGMFLISNNFRNREEVNENYTLNK